MSTSAQFSTYGLSFSDLDDQSNVIEKEILSAEDYAKDFILSIIDDSKDDPSMKNVFEPNMCLLYKINKDNSTTLISAAADVYDLLDKKISIKNSYGILLHTCGWAAPLSDQGTVDGPPSQNPQRRRVALICCVTDQGAGSALSFNDNPFDIVTDPGSATGTLAEAIVKFWKNSK